MSQPSPQAQEDYKKRDRDLLWFRKQPDRVNFANRIKREELKPCPFCPANVYIDEDNDVVHPIPDDLRNPQCIIQCIAFPLNEWNRRAPTPDTRLRELAQELELWLRVVEFTHDRHDRMAADFSQRLGAALAEKEGEK